jgi:hypothetical protein
VDFVPGTAAYRELVRARASVHRVIDTAVVAPPGHAVNLRVASGE